MVPQIVNCKSYIVNYLNLLLLLLTQAGCQVLKTERPPEGYQKMTLSPRYSTINIPVMTDAARLKRMVNREFYGVIYADTSFEDNDKDDLMVVASKRDSITISMTGNQVSYRVPLRVWIKKRFTAGLLGLSYSTEKETTAEVALKFRTTLSINKDWTLNSITVSDGYDWITYPQLSLGPLQIPLPVIPDILLKSNLPAINRGIDRSIRESFPIRTLVTDAWRSMQKPITISADPPLWLRVTPVEGSTIPFRATATNISHSIGIKALVQLSFGDEPTFTPNETLPPLKITSALPDNFSINFSMDLPFSHLNAMAGKQFNGYVLNYRTYHITVKDITLYGQADRLIVALNVDGSIRGTLYLSGVPVYNKTEMTLGLTDLDFHISTKNVLIKSASWVFHSGLLQKMAASLVFPVGEQLKATKTELNSYLDKQEPLSHFTIHGAVDKFEPDQIIITPEGVKAFFLLEGKIQLIIDN